MTSQAKQQPLDLAAALTAALVRGLQLYVSSCCPSPMDSTNRDADGQQTNYQGCGGSSSSGLTDINCVEPASSSGPVLMHGQQIPPASGSALNVFESLWDLAVVLNKWVNIPEEIRRSERNYIQAEGFCLLCLRQGAMGVFLPGGSFAAHQFEM